MILTGFICEFFALGGGTVAWTVPYDCTVFSIITTAAMCVGPFGAIYPTAPTNALYFVAPASGSFDVAIDFRAGQVVYLSPKTIGTSEVVLLHSPDQGKPA